MQAKKEKDRRKGRSGLPGKRSTYLFSSHAFAFAADRHLMSSFLYLLSAPPLTYRNSFAHLGFDHAARTRLLVRQREIIQEIAEAGNDCLIVGRDADVILHEYQPFRIYVCADMQSRLARCARFEEKREPAERLTEKEILRNIRRIDRNRRQTREILTGKSAADGSAFDLTVNATGWDIGKLAEAVADFSARWFER